MGIIVKSEELNDLFKTGLAKVKDSQTIIQFNKGELTVTFSGTSVRYQRKIAGEGKSLPALEFDAALLMKLINTYKGDIEISLDNAELKVKRGRSSVKVACVKSNMFMSIDDTSDEGITTEDGLFNGWVQKHPLNSAISLRKALQSIRDNIAKTELVVEAEWGKSDLLKVKIVDQFHGIMAYVKLEEKPSKNKVRIRVPLSSFLLMLDVQGDLYVDSSRVLIKNSEHTLECRFVSGAAFGTIDDMTKLVEDTKPQLTCDGKELNAIVKRITSIAESDDTIRVAMAKDKLVVEASTVKATIREVLKSDGTLQNEAILPPKNLNDITSCLSGKVSIGEAGRSLIFKSTVKDITIHGALVKMGD